MDPITIYIFIKKSTFKYNDDVIKMWKKFPYVSVVA